MQYDYIISGFGAAGMSLLYRMMNSPFFHDKQILVVDKEIKNTNDHTWCFWEKEESVFESVVHHQWKDVHFYSNFYSGLLSLSPYRYKMIRSIDLYNHVLSQAALRQNITFIYGTVNAVINEGSLASLTVNSNKYTANYIFNSIIFGSYHVPENKHHLLQHFKGYVIETALPAFNENVATLMDFRVSQQHGTTFMYVLPVANNKALVEYTLFTPHLLKQEEYSRALHEYITGVLQIGQYTIAEEEFGVIPMTNIQFENQKGKVVNIGTAGGNTKPSTGYTFRFIQKQCDEIIIGLQHNNLNLATSVVQKKFLWYDSVLLNVLSKNRMKGDLIFSTLFKKNKAHEVLKFLDNESNMGEDLKIISSLPVLPFLKAGLQEVFT